MIPCTFKTPHGEMFFPVPSVPSIGQWVQFKDSLLGPQVVWFRVVDVIWVYSDAPERAATAEVHLA